MIKSITVLVVTALLPLVISSPVAPGDGEPMEKTKVAVPDACWIANYGREIGKSPVCGEGMEENAGLCYKKCEGSMRGVGPMCWPKHLTYNRGDGTTPKDCGGEQPVKDNGLCYPECKEGFKGIGPVCSHFPKSYDRGAGRIPNKCPPGLELHHGLCYKPCEEDFYGVGSVCWAKQSVYNRGEGKAPTECAEGQVFHSSMCYSECEEGYTGVGPVCWQESCGSLLSFKCGPLCTSSTNKCNELLKKKGADAFDKDMDAGFELFNSLSKYTTCTKVSQTLRDHPAAKSPKSTPDAPKEAKAAKAAGLGQPRMVKAASFIPNPFQRD